MRRMLSVSFHRQGPRAVSLVQPEETVKTAGEQQEQSGNWRGIAAPIEKRR
jgi:hypothetical protein